MFAGQGLVNVAAAAAPTSTGTVIPTAPGPNDVFREGGQCTFSWTPDPSGTWKQTDVELMTGDNFNMVFLTTVASFDGTDPKLTTMSYPCPDVEPNSAIYFYQFSTPVAPTALTWTTRFAIADAQGNTTPPPNATQANGQQIPWGTGKLADPSKAVPEPGYLLPGGASASASASTTGSTSSAASGSSSASSSGSASSTTSDSNSSTSSDSATTTNAPSSTSSDTASRIVTVTRTASTGQSAPTDGSGSDNGSGSGNGSNGGSTDNGALAVRSSWSSAVLALGLTAAVFAVAT
ncbi:hypothetical protein FKP32DRAFT_1573489 [Trametes sanguinea]|nr:hypothetical protein FKP32DRAFT_1573489 [Trametes sanguinea]